MSRQDAEATSRTIRQLEGLGALGVSVFRLAPSADWPPRDAVREAMLSMQRKRESRTRSGRHAWDPMLMECERRYILATKFVFRLMNRLAHRAFALTLIGSFLVASTSRAQAPSGDASCEAVEQTEAMRAEGQYRKARARLLECVNAQCGGDVRRRCAVTLQRLDAVTPSIVVRAEDSSGNDLTDVAVSLGDERLVNELDGMAIPVDPGEHRFVFTREGYTPVVQTLTIEQGQKFRAIDVVIGSPPTLALPPAVVRSDRGSATTERVAASATLIGVGMIGVAGFAVLGLRARSGEAVLERCEPECSKGRVHSVRTRYLLANVSAGVGALALGAATYLLLSGSSDDSVAEPADRGLAVGADATGAFASYSGRF